MPISTQNPRTQHSHEENRTFIALFSPQPPRTPHTCVQRIPPHPPRGKRAVFPTLHPKITSESARPGGSPTSPSPSTLHSIPPSPPKLNLSFALTFIPLPPPFHLKAKNADSEGGPSAAERSAVMRSGPVRTGAGWRSAALRMRAPPPPGRRAPQ